MTNESRLYYAVWSSPASADRLGQPPEDEKRNAVWSVRLSSNGVRTGGVRREPCCRTSSSGSSDIGRAGYSQPVSDISFSECGQRPVMLVAERGGIRNLGLDAENAFANPHEARALRYEVDSKGTWRPVVATMSASTTAAKEGPPFMRANCSGGIAFGSATTNGRGPPTRASRTSSVDHG